MPVKAEDVLRIMREAALDEPVWPAAIYLFRVLLDALPQRACEVYLALRSRELTEGDDWTSEEIARYIGISRSHAANLLAYLRTLGLAESLQAHFTDDKGDRRWVYVWTALSPPGLEKKARENHEAEL